MYGEDLKALSVNFGEDLYNTITNPSTLSNDQQISITVNTNADTVVHCNNKKNLKAIQTDTE